MCGVIPIKPSWVKYKSILFTVLTVFITALFCGCNEGPWYFSNKEVKEYLEEKYPDSGVQFKRFSLNVWNCWFPELPDAVFQVEVKASGGDPVPVYHNHLSSNADLVIWRYYLDHYRDQGGSLDAWDITQLLSGETYMTLEYESMEEIRKAAEQLRTFYDWTEGKPYTNCLESGRFCFSPSRFPWTVEKTLYKGGTWDGFFQGPEDSLEDIIDQCSREIQKYYSFYNIPCPDFTGGEMSAYAAENLDWQTLEGLPNIKKDGEPFSPETFSGIGVFPRYGIVSYGGLYQMLLRLGFEVEGTPEHFSVTGADGAEYEFSYDFCYEMEFDSKLYPTVTVWYFLRNGLRVQRTEKPYWWETGPVLSLTDYQWVPKEGGSRSLEHIITWLTGLRFDYKRP